MNGLARASLRFRPASFAGTFVALFAAAVVAMACGSLLQTGLTAAVEPVRYADAPIVVTADQYARRWVTVAGDREEISAVLPEGARIDTSVGTRISTVPGVSVVVGDLSVDLIGEHTGPVVGRDWSTNVLSGGAGSVLTEGSAPNTGEIVVDAETAAASGLAIGDSLTLVAPDGGHDFRVVGIAATRPATAGDGPDGPGAAVWFADGTAAALSEQPDRVDAIAVFTGAEADVAAVAEAIRAVVGDDMNVYSGIDRGRVEAPALPDAQELLIGFGGSFGGTATFGAIFVVIATVALAIAQRRRDIALLRAIGATPRQIRRMVAAETLMIAPLAGAAAVLPGWLLARWWFDQLVSRGALPIGINFSSGVIPAAAAVGAGLLAGLGGGYFAARRPAQIPPSQALGEAVIERRELGKRRSVFGAIVVAVAVFLSVITYRLDGGSAAVASIGVVMLFLLAVALFGPVVARVATAAFEIVLRRGGATSSLAATNSRANSRRLASAITPITLVVGSSGVLLFIQTTIAHATTTDIEGGLVADFVVASDGPGLPEATAGVVADTEGVATAVGVLRSEVLYSGFEDYAAASVIAVDGDSHELASVLDLGVVEGSMADVGAGTVAIDHLLARALDAEVGDTVEFRLGDGAEFEPTVVAVYERGLGLGQVVMSHETLRNHVRAPWQRDVLAAVAPGADADTVAARLAAIDVPGILVTDRDGFTASVDEGLELEAWSNRVMAAVFGGFATVAAVNTLVMVVLDRRREVALLRLTGTTRRQVRAMFRWEAAIVAATGIGLGATIAWFTLFGFASGATGGPPHVPVLQGIGLLTAAGAITFGAVAVPSRVLLASPPNAGVE